MANEIDNSKADPQPDGNPAPAKSAEFDRTMEIARRVMAKNHRLLRALADADSTGESLGAGRDKR